MRFLERLNPNATREGLKKHAIVGGITLAIAGGAMFYLTGMPAIGVFLSLPFLAVGGALSAGAVYWQLDDDPDDDDPDATPDRDDG